MSHIQPPTPNQVSDTNAVKTRSVTLSTPTMSTASLTKQSSIKKFEQSKQTLNSVQVGKYISEKDEPVSQFRRISKYFNFPNTTFSTTESSIARQRIRDSVASISKNAAIVTSCVASVSTKQHPNTGK